MKGAMPTSIPGARGFTLIELLVAMAILLIIVMIVAQLFQQARQVVDTGSRRVETNMRGRAVADFMAQELSMAVNSTNSFSASGGTAEFDMLGDATESNRAVQRVTYGFSGGVATRSRDGGPLEDLCDGIQDVEFIEDVGAAPYDVNELPLYVNVRVTVSDGGTPATPRVFESRAYMVHRDRRNTD